MNNGHEECNCNLAFGYLLIVHPCTPPKSPNRPHALNHLLRSSWMAVSLRSLSLRDAGLARPFRPQGGGGVCSHASEKVEDVSKLVGFKVSLGLKFPRSTAAYQRFGACAHLFQEPTHVSFVHDQRKAHERQFQIIALSLDGVLCLATQDYLHQRGL